MDTVEISLEVKNNLGMKLVQELRNDITSLKSPLGFRFCDVLEFSRTGNLIVKISYPRYFSGSNAFLIDRRSQCFEVQRYFAENIMENEFWRQNIGELKLLRVDIPFTYYMKDTERFTSYENIFHIMGIVYNELKLGARPKAFVDMIDNSMETAIYSDNGKSDKSSNNRLIVYNQYANLSSKLDGEVLEETLNTYVDLSKRIRMEVSKRIRLRRSFNSQEFSNEDILGHYFEDYKNYILTYALNINKIDELYNISANKLTQILDENRALKNFNYEVFILQHLEQIYDYEILKRALGTNIESQSTREKAVAKVRKILNGIQNERNIIVIDTYAVLIKMINTISDYQLLD